MTTTITGISSMATRLILGELAQRYEAAKGVKVSIGPAAFLPRCQTA